MRRGNAVYLGCLTYFFEIILLVAIVLLCVGRDEGVHTYLTFRLVAVCGKPSEVVHLIDDHHVVVGRRVEGHTQILGHEVAVGVAIVSRDVEVISAQSARIVVGEVYSHSVR